MDRLGAHGRWHTIVAPHAPGSRAKPKAGPIALGIRRLGLGGGVHRDAGQDGGAERHSVSVEIDWSIARLKFDALAISMDELTPSNSHASRGRKPPE